MCRLAIWNNRLRRTPSSGNCRPLPANLRVTTAGRKTLPPGFIAIKSLICLKVRVWGSLQILANRNAIFVFVYNRWHESNATRRQKNCGRSMRPRSPHLKKRNDVQNKLLNVKRNRRKDRRCRRPSLLAPHFFRRSWVAKRLVFPRWDEQHQLRAASRSEEHTP